MKKYIQNILNVKGILLILLFYTFAFFLQIVNTDYVTNDKVWYEYLAEKEDQKYNDEYDEYLADFEEDLKEIDLPEEDDAYGWDFFLMDSTMVLAPFVIVCLGLTALIFIAFQFSEHLKHITFRNTMNSAILSYLVFFLGDIFSALYFLIFKSDYQYEDVQNINNNLSFALNDVIKIEDKTSWVNDVLADVNLYVFAYILLIPLFLHIVSNLSYRKLLQAILLPVLCGFVLYESVMIYLTI
ncbi:hypothetical protein [Marinifilum fragile]|uniref:hypothetical protein n=1 Tax=Marinifilum fragile TaxID=570161 RepID=UPI002AA6542D|nr:hypothetical protein [Marinifilum fragile]